MATVNYISYGSQNKSALKAVTQYVERDDKTAEKKFVSGQNCSPQFAYQQFVATRNEHRKNSPVWFYHYTQSFSPQEIVTPELAHTIAKEFAAKAWSKSEVLITTHIDREHIHSHFIVNAVCYESGKMLRQGPKTIQTLRAISDGLCMKYGLSVIEQKAKHSQGVGTREYRSAVKGQSWKYRLINMIDQCMRQSGSRDEFVALMEKNGYSVRWESGRKSITYTTPSGMSCRGEKLHEEKYRKENMEYEFRIREEIISGRIKADEQAAANTVFHSAAADYYSEPNAGWLCQSDAANAANDTIQAGSNPVLSQHESIGRGYEEADAHCGADESNARTGWEEEREAFFSQENSSVAAAYQWPDTVHSNHSSSNLVSSVALLGKAIESLQSPAMTGGSNGSGHIDKKRYRKLKEKKIALGQKEDDHEQKRSPNMTMM